MEVFWPCLAFLSVFAFSVFLIKIYLHEKAEREDLRRSEIKAQQNKRTRYFLLENPKICEVGEIIPGREYVVCEPSRALPADVDPEEFLKQILKGLTKKLQAKRLQLQLEIYLHGSDDMDMAKVRVTQVDSESEALRNFCYKSRGLPVIHHRLRVFVKAN